MKESEVNKELRQRSLINIYIYIIYIIYDSDNIIYIYMYIYIYIYISYVYIYVYIYICTYDIYIYGYFTSLFIYKNFSMSVNDHHRQQQGTIVKQSQLLLRHHTPCYPNRSQPGEDTFSNAGSTNHRVILHKCLDAVHLP